MPKLGTGKVDTSVVYRVLEEQEKYIRNLVREKKRKNVQTSPSEEMRYLLELGIKMHREGRREKYEMSHYFRAELRTFTENFFKENNENYIFKLTEMSRYVRFITLMMIDALGMLYKIYFTLKEQTDFGGDQTTVLKSKYFEKIENEANAASKNNMNSSLEKLGKEGMVLENEMQINNVEVFYEPEFIEVKREQIGDKELDDIFTGLESKD